MKLKRFVILSVLLSATIVIGYLESFIPSFFIPGVKLGLANIVILLTMLYFKWYEALIISLLGVLIISLLVGTFLNVIFLMSLFGAIASFLVMILILKTKIHSLIFISMAGSIAHAVGQIAAAILIMQTTMVIYYLPFILLLSIPTGIFVGIVVRALCKINAIDQLLNTPH